jgi:hypothetical protein
VHQKQKKAGYFVDKNQLGLTGTGGNTGSYAGELWCKFLVTVKHGYYENTYNGNTTGNGSDNVQYNKFITDTL